MRKLLSPSLLSADFTKLDQEVNLLNRSEADYLHIDVMDGVFVPNISFGQSITKQIKRIATKPLDVHLMIIDPDRYFSSFMDAGADLLCVHYEACTHLHRSLSGIRQLGMKAGVALNPHTPVELLTDILNECDLVLLMSVNPGFGGQKFIEQVYSKIERLHQMRSRLNPACLIEVDGGVNLENAPKLYAAGADILVAGNAVFASAKPEETILSLKGLPLSV